MNNIFQRIYIALLVLKCKTDDTRDYVFKGAKWRKLGGFPLSLNIRRKKRPQPASV